MSVEIAWKQNILITDSNLLKSLLVVFGFGSQAFVCGFSRQNINSVRYVLCSVLYSSDTTRVIDNRYLYLFWWDLPYVVSRNKKVAKRSEASFAHFLTSSYIVYLLQTPLHRRSLSYLFLTQHDALNQII